MLTKLEMKYQLVEPHSHHTNAADRAIRTFKNQFITGLCTTDKHFPLQSWDRLLPQAKLTLKLLQQLRLNPIFFSEAQLNGNVDLNATPLPPPGTKAVVFDDPQTRRTWDTHGTDAWYIGHAPEHYSCYQFFCPLTKGTRIGQNTEFFPHHCHIPHTSSAYRETLAATELTEALRNLSPATPFPQSAPKPIRPFGTLAIF